MGFLSESQADDAVTGSAFLTLYTLPKALVDVVGRQNPSQLDSMWIPGRATDIAHGAAVRRWWWPPGITPATVTRPPRSIRGPSREEACEVLRRGRRKHHRMHPCGLSAIGWILANMARSYSRIASAGSSCLVSACASSAPSSKA
jgi:hypothetical protein